jgi:peptide/nickel transport system substrate-binding protein
VSGQFSIAIGEAALADQAKSSGLTIVRQDKGVAVNVLWLNRARNNLGNPLVRQALSHAIDRDALIKLAFGAGTSTLQILPDGINDPTQTAKGWFDPVLAKKLLTDAGFPNGFKLGMLTYTRPELQQQSTAIQAMFKQIGVDTEIRAVDPTQFGVFLNGEIDTWYATSSGRTDPLEALTSMYGSAGNTNPAKTTSAGLDAMIAKAGGTAPGPDRDKLVQQISGLAAQDVLTIPTYFPSRFWFSKCVVGFAPNVSGAQSLRGVGIASNCK